MLLDAELPPLIAALLPRFAHAYDDVWEYIPEEALANILHSLVHHTYHNPEFQECLGACRGLPEGLCSIMQCRHDPSQGFAALCMSQIALAGMYHPHLSPSPRDLWCIFTYMQDGQNALSVTVG
jgi:hypothetical protein